MSGADPGEELWRDMLGAGGFTKLPRWSRAPVPGVGRCELMLPDELVARLRRLADRFAVPLGSVLLAAHAEVLAALSGEQEVTTGYVAANGDPDRPLLCRLTTGPGSWRTLVLDSHRVVSAVLEHSTYPAVSLARELGLSGPWFETVFDPAGREGALGDGVVLWVAVAGEPNRGLRLRLRYRTDVLDAECAARVAGYHLTALGLVAADPDAERRPQSLLGAEELHFQVEGLSGRRRELPDRRIHELFEERAAAHPDAVAAVCGERRWSYRELDVHANRLARALLARGLQREGVVAVVTKRGLDWLAAVLAVFKAGGVYLPIEPQFPATRIATMLSRAGCGLVLTDRDGAAAVDQALATLPHVRAISVETGYTEGHADDDPGIGVSANQLAYIFFTSGSTGEPKGAMCEHAGLLNHLLAKIDDLEIRQGRVVAQTAPQCFDISLWQLVSALLVGGRTLLVDDDAILDAERFVDTITTGRVAVLQVVPSYLEVLLSYLEQHPREMPHVRCVSVTGEVLKKELVQRWFAAMPGIKLVNAYGLTETSDDTNHEVMAAVPDGEQVPLGRPIDNVHVYVVDEHLWPVPLGATGEIVVSGVCVGRGYVNDPDLTRRVFMADPHREGHRLYRTGDYGRWQPMGKLEFVGRRDTQVKISGFRIEVGEIERALVRITGIRDAAVAVAERADAGKQLLAFYSGPRQLESDALRALLRESLPEYMVPSAFHWQERLPLTANGKVDRKTLATLAESLEASEPNGAGPRTPTEHRLAEAWANVLGTPKAQIARQDHFFDLGGTSITAVKLAIVLDRAVSVRDVNAQPVLADLAALVDGRSERHSGLLQRLVGSDDAPAGALVCFPDAGGNAVNFQPLASALRGTGLALYAVELPGHDLTAGREPFAPLGEVVERVVAEIVERRLSRVLLWGHSSGGAFALATAGELRERGVEVVRVFLAAQLLGDASDRRAGISELAARSDAEIAESLRADSGNAALRELDAARAEHLAAAFRHDCVCAHRYLAEALEDPAADRLSVPVTVVVAADDPSTAGFSRRYREWELVAEDVELHELAEGGYFFPATCPAEAARAVLGALTPSASS